MAKSEWNKSEWSRSLIGIIIFGVVTLMFFYIGTNVVGFSDGISVIGGLVLGFAAEFLYRKWTAHKRMS
ncbi:hypothetical protein M3689_02070 [Alkalihalophilus marmarensis]|uniref:Uncharacterized protein n=1 Tax=Alkalihalophilus marmarensis DSM 21297 TaxID=1188261 RepID=U6SPV6_9BACI|nr:hypothetical protein [Alkalihalophilus marmarensis]ERN52686.1 hypothetical protein A33I_14760 [Alkalihalophilus marmarensis DSM 21297]MCM3488089.1 hypothetical protein [Alkalihalophilus marmarensis]